MRSSLIAVLWLVPSLALAQTATPPDLLGPANPQMKGPPTTYRAVFGTGTSGPESTPWRDANDEVRRLGGHVGQLRESEEPVPAGHDTQGAAKAPQRTHTHDHK